MANLILAILVIAFFAFLGYAPEELIKFLLALAWMVGAAFAIGAMAMGIYSMF